MYSSCVAWILFWCAILSLLAVLFLVLQEHCLVISSIVKHHIRCNNNGLLHLCGQLMKCSIHTLWFFLSSSLPWYHSLKTMTKILVGSCLPLTSSTFIQCNKKAQEDSVMLLLASLLKQALSIILSDVGNTEFTINAGEIIWGFFGCIPELNQKSFSSFLGQRAYQITSLPSII